jgi:hypothetical protein
VRPVVLRPAMAAAGGGAAHAQPAAPAPAGHEEDPAFPFRRPEPAAAPRAAEPRPAAEPQLRPAPAPPAKAADDDEPEHVPFYRKVIAHARGEDPHGYGPNWSNVDDYDIPTVLRKQMD